MHVFSSFWKSLVLFVVITQVPLAVGTYMSLHMINANSVAEPFSIQYLCALLHVATLIFALVGAYLIGVLISIEVKQEVSQGLVAYKGQFQLKHFNEWVRIAKKLSHEIKNPLTPIEMTMGNLVRIHETLEHNTFSEKLKETHEVIIEEVRKMGKLLNDFSRFSKLPAAKLEVNVFYPFVAQFADERRHENPDLNVEFQADENTKKLTCRFDAQLLYHCLKSITDNAREALPNIAGSCIDIQLRANNKEFSLIIQNRGQCLTDEQREHVFDIYYTTKSSTHNLGLGLSVAKKIMLEHCGDICCLPDNNGVTVLITLPIQK